MVRLADSSTATLAAESSKSRTKKNRAATAARSATNSKVEESKKRRQQRRQQRQKTALPPPRDDLAVLVITVFGAFWFVSFIIIGMSKFPTATNHALFPSQHGPSPLQVQQNQKQNQNSKLPKFPILHRHDNNNDNKDDNLSQEALDMCHQTLWHTLETTTIVLPNDETFIHTGDIDDLWLRDSAAQIHPLLVPNMVGTQQSLVQLDPKLARVVSGLIQRTAMYIRHDPYANAFRIDDTYVFNEAQKAMGRHDLISTWNYELDSACYYMRMLYFFYQSLPTHSVLHQPQVVQSVEIMIDLWIAEQQHENDVYPQGPYFDCINCNKPYRYPGLQRNGKGTPTNPKSGLTWTGFRPSDDECVYGYLIPANMFAVVVLGYMSEMALHVWHNPPLAKKATKLAQEIEQGIQQYGIVHHGLYGNIYAYEVDGLGNSLLMDDANVPSLMSIPYLGYAYNEEVYQNTRRFILSKDNPTYQSGQYTSSQKGVTTKFEGYGSPHMAKQIPNNIWPMSIAMQGLTSTSKSEKLKLIEMLVQASAGTHWMHESFNANNPTQYTRRWFCWADSLFAELVMSVTTQCPIVPQQGRRGGKKYKVMEWRDVQHPMKGSIFDSEA